MGVESFLVTIRGPREEYLAVALFAESEFRLTPEPPPSYGSGDCLYYSFGDGRHVIEWEFAPYPGEYLISVRFALCHPPTVDSVFIDLICRILQRFNATATVCEPMPDGTVRSHRADTLAQFAQDCLCGIQICRRDWQAMFGTRTASLSHKDAMLRFVLPQCVPAAADDR